MDGSQDGARVGLRQKIAVILMALGLLGAGELAVLTWSDVSQIAGARHAAYEAATAAEYEAAPSTAAPGKVALMFLIRSDLPTEPLWRLFLDSATAAVRGAAVGGRRGGAGHSGWEQLFSVYVHPAAGRHLPRGSLFARHEVPDRVGAVWGNHSIVDAERALLRAALHDPLNQRFVLLSETCVPVYSTPEIYTQLLSENRSRINACRDAADPNDGNRRMTWRWQPGMLQANVTRDTWRKSSQWFMLTRRHAEVVVRDVAVDAVFRAHCWTARNWNDRFCTSDEHYVPTLLAWSGLEGEATCGGGITYTEWRARAAHPTSFKEATGAVLAQMRGGCNGSALAAAAVEAVGRLLRAPRGGGGQAAGLANNGTGADAASSAVLAALGNLTSALLPPTCPMFGRKVPGSSVKKWAALLEPVMQAG